MSATCELGTSFCDAVPNSTGLSGRIRAFGDTQHASNQLLLMADRLPADKWGIFFRGDAQVLVQNPGGSLGTLCAGGTILRFEPILVGAAGIATYSPDIPNLPGGHVWSLGDTLLFQFWHRDNIPQSVSNMTDAIKVQLQ